MPELIDWADRFLFDTFPTPPDDQLGECEWCRVPLAGLPRLFEVFEVHHDGEPVAVACSQGCAQSLAEEAAEQINRWRRAGFFA